jgi:hypothetical protein
MIIVKTGKAIRRGLFRDRQPAAQRQWLLRCQLPELLNCVGSGATVALLSRLTAAARVVRRIRWGAHFHANYLRGPVPGRS